MLMKSVSPGKLAQLSSRSSTGPRRVFTLGRFAGERGRHVRAIQERTGTHILSANSDVCENSVINRNITENERPNRKFLITVSHNMKHPANICFITRWHRLISSPPCFAQAVPMEVALSHSLPQALRKITMHYHTAMVIT